MPEVGASPPRPRPSTTTPPPTAFLYGNYACPHTYIAQARMDLLASEAPVRIVWRPLPTMRQEETGEGADSGSAGWEIAAEEGVSLQETVQSLRRDAAALGLTFSLPPRRPDSRLALQAAEFARDCGARDFRRLHHALFRAVFVDGADVGDTDVVLGLAEEAGLDREGLEATLGDGRYESALREVEEEAARYAIEATPTMLLGKYKLVGAAPLDLLRSTLERAAADAAAEAADAAGAADAEDPGDDAADHGA